MDGHRPWVLLVEDHRPTRQAMRRLLHRGGWETIEAATIAEGLAALESDGPPGCIILDLDLPDGPGEVLLRKVRAGGQPTRVVVNTGMHDPTRLGELAYLRPDAILIKPIEPTRLCRECEAATAALTDVPSP